VDAVSAYIIALDEALADRFEAYRAHLEFLQPSP